MKNRHEKVLNSAKEWLSTVDRDEFINDLLELQGQATGPTVDEFLSTFTNSTASLFGLSDNVNEKSLFDDLPLSNSVSLKISRTARNETIASFEKNNSICTMKSMISNIFDLEGKMVRNNSNEFTISNTDISLCKVA